MRWLVTTAVLIASCTAAPPAASPTSVPTVAATATPAPTQPATPTVAPAKTASAAPAADVMDLCGEEREGCELEAGTYSPSRTTPTMTFTLDDGWTGVRHYEDGFAIVRDEAIVSFARDVEPAGTGSIEPGLPGVEAFLRDLAVLRVAEAGVATVGGLPALQLDVVATEDARAFLELDKDVYNLVAGQKARFLIVDIGGTIGMFIVESESEATFDAAIEAAQPVIDSVAFD
jgi:hypothetical protein